MFWVDTIGIPALVTQYYQFLAFTPHNLSTQSTKCMVFEFSGKEQSVCALIHCVHQKNDKCAKENWQKLVVNAQKNTTIMKRTHTHYSWSITDQNVSRHSRLPSSLM